MTVLIVDDSAVMRKVIERTLRQAGLPLANVLEAANGMEALERLRTAGEQQVLVSLVMTDINMPEMDGLEFVRQAYSEGLTKDVPVVMITTEGSEQHVTAAIVAGARGYIRKPFTAEQVKVRVLPLVRV